MRNRNGRGDLPFLQKNNRRASRIRYSVNPHRSILVFTITTSLEVILSHNLRNLPSSLQALDLVVKIIFRRAASTVFGHIEDEAYATCMFMTLLMS